MVAIPTIRVANTFQDYQHVYSSITGVSLKTRGYSERWWVYPLGGCTIATLVVTVARSNFEIHTLAGILSITCGERFSGAYNARRGEGLRVLSHAFSPA